MSRSPWKWKGNAGGFKFEVKKIWCNGFNCLILKIYFNIYLLKSTEALLPSFVWISVWWPSLIIYTINAERATEKGHENFSCLSIEDNSIQIKQTVVVYIHSFLLKRIYSNVDLTKQQYLHMEWAREKTPLKWFIQQILERKILTKHFLSLSVESHSKFALRFTHENMYRRKKTFTHSIFSSYLCSYSFLLLLVTSFPSSSFCTRRKKRRENL